MQQQNGNDESKIFDTYTSQDNPENAKKDESTEQKVDSESINKIEDYTEIIPQKIENKQKSTPKEEKILNLNNINNKNESIEDNYDTQNLDFSFGKGLKQDNNTDENVKNITDLKKINNNNNNNNNITNSKNDNNINNSKNDNKNNNSNSKDINDNNKDNYGKDINSKNDSNLNKNNINNNQNLNEFVEKREILSDNLSNYQMTDSTLHYFDIHFDGNKKLKLIKEKFLCNFKNKERSESLEKALILFDKYSNYGKFKLNINLNHSFTNRFDNPFKTYQNGNNSKNEEKNEISYIKRKKYSVNNLEINCINSPSDNGDNKIILKKMVNRKKVKKKSKDKEKDKEKEHNTYDKLNLKNEKKNGFYIRKVIREEKYFIDKEGKEKLIGIKQSIFDSQNANDNGGGKVFNINKNKSFKSSQNKTLLNSKKIKELIKGKISNKKDVNVNNKASFSLRNNISKNNIKNKNVELIGNKSLQKNFNGGDKCNNIKIVINKINKINSNPKINLNFIKKYRNQNNTNQNNTNQNQNNISINNLSRNDNNNNSNNKTFHLIKVDKCKNQNESKKIISNFHQYKNLIHNYSSNYVQKGGYSGKLKVNDKLKIIKCEKFEDNKILGKNCISNNDIRFTLPNNQRAISNKRNYSFKEVRNLSNNIKKYEKYNNNKKYLTIDTYSHNDKKIYKNSRNNSNVNEQNIFNKTNRNNHTFYESKSFSSKKKINQRFKNNNTKIIKSYGNRNESSSQMNSINLDENKTNVSHSVYYYQYATNNFGTKRNNMSIINNNNIYNINTSFNTNIYSYNNGT